jgi:hypothetical protein
MKQTINQLLALGILSLASYSQAAPIEIGNCVDHESQFKTGIFQPHYGGTVGEVQLFDQTAHRRPIPLFCGLNNNPADPIEVACASADLSSDNSGKVFRLRIHRKIRSDLPRMGVLELQSSFEQPGGINYMIPLICND